MGITEKDRLDLRAALAETLGSDHLADVAMEAMPPLEYDKLATKADVDLLGRELRGEMAELRGEMAELRGEMAELRGEMHGEFAKVRTEAVGNLRLMLAGQLATMVMLGGWITAVG